MTENTTSLRPENLVFLTAALGICNNGTNKQRCPDGTAKGRVRGQPKGCRRRDGVCVWTTWHKLAKLASTQGLAENCELVNGITGDKKAPVKSANTSTQQQDKALSADTVSS